MSKSKNVILYTDIGDDVDDALALCHLIEHTKHNILAIIVSHGNLLNRIEHAQKICNLYDVKIPILVWNSEPFNNRTVWIEDKIQQDIHKLAEKVNKVTLLCIGPCTDIAKTLMYSPVEFLQKIERLIFQWDTTDKPRQADEVNSYNFKCDPRAARIATDTGFKTSFIGKQLAYANPMRKQDFLTFSKNKQINEYLLHTAIDRRRKFRILNPEKYNEIYWPDESVLSYPYDLIAAKAIDIPYEERITTE